MSRCFFLPVTSKTFDSNTDFSDMESHVIIIHDKNSEVSASNLPALCGENKIARILTPRRRFEWYRLS